ncbi:hypothetical protein [Caulobacter segnis]|uniref:hypothetical protein n=1 Tax=Caulobacter segnis TaxID=88688 RepID=UPI00285E06DE|nr:hypothetical protein [Caulobacter segnis]MDR6627904.1 hypothetical protein [Caulobacter segnis]
MADDDFHEPSADWVARRFGVSLEEAEWVLVLYRFQALYPEGPEPGRFYCEIL